MDNIVLRYVFDRKKQADNDNVKGLLQIEVRKRSSNKCIYISTGIKLYKNQFSDKNGFTCVNHNNSTLLTAKGRRIFTKLEAYVLSEKCNDLKDAKNYDKEETNKDLFIPFIRKSLARKNLSYGSIKNHNVLIHQLEGFNSNLSFSDISYSTILLFDEFLRKTISSSSTLHKRHSMFKGYINEAIKLGLLTNDPYLLFKMPSSRSNDPVFLEDFEIQKIIEYTPENSRLQKVKDLFLFQIFTGLAYVDMQKFSINDIFLSGEDKVIRSSRTKTDICNISWFLPEADEIAQKYNYELPRISNQKYNDYLKLLAAGAGVKKNLTTHVARHTYATYLLNKGVSLEVVSKAMGHSSVKMTQHYAKLLASTVVSEMRSKLSAKTNKF